MVLQTFDSVDKAAAALQGAGAHFLGGGTLVVRALNSGDLSIKTLVRLLDPEGHQSPVVATADHVVIRATATMSQLIASPGLEWLAPAASSVGSPAVRNMATVGGNLYAPPPYGDFGVALLALDATVSVVGPDGLKHWALEDFFDGRDDRQRQSIVISVRFTPGRGAFRYRKVARVKPNGASVMSLAAVIQEKQGIVSEARVTYGAMARTPIRARSVERALIGRPRTPEGIADAVSQAHADTEPFDDPICTAWYRRAVVGVHLKRLLLSEAGER